jgi:hypothetical protein
MENVPKIVLKRLQSPAAESHPDADQLTAFAEHSLAGRERDQVVDHLARCGDCREAVALALPADVELPALADRGTNWLRWPVLGWAAVAAGVLLIASVGTVQYRRQHSNQLAANVFYPKQEVTTPAQSSAPSTQPVPPQTQMRKYKSAAEPRTLAVLAENKHAVSAGGSFHGSASSPGAIGGTIGGPIIPSSPGLPSAPALENPASATNAKQNPTPGPAQPTMASSASTTVEVSADAGQVAAQTAAQGQIQDQLIQSELAEQSPASADQPVGKAKPASAQASPAVPAPPLRSDPALMNSRKAPRWTISVTGILQRSDDGGKTWLDVNVASMNAQSMSAQPMSANLVRSAKSTVAAAITVFRALSVSANAAGVWAGGSGGALYHTIDGGNRWARVVPSDGGIILTGDIIGIQFSDALNGTVTTSATEVWTTADGGQTWHKQQ